jgi:hypothetical protein
MFLKIANQLLGLLGHDLHGLRDIDDSKARDDRFHRHVITSSTLEQLRTAFPFAFKKDLTRRIEEQDQLRPRVKFF